ncbi:MAG: hydrolase [Gammaproteobacteria bacterium]|nr:hydrolase [Gammaproteobacteria bacterium]MCW8987439.1 hydrolase [Gammaproteobacteria bacterium]MCW9029869.1 hydrolase [Gammaproteobacteria bacterium]
MSLSLNEKLCHAQHSQLLIIDIQDRLASAMPADVLEKVIKQNNVLLNAASELGIPVIHSEQYPKGLGNTVAEISQHIPDTGVSIEKTCFSCSEADGFYDVLAKNKRQQIVITGIESHICVLQSAIQLQRHGYTVYVVEDAVCSRKKSNHKNAIKRLRQSGVIITNVESVVFEWLRDASHPAFKTISALIK